MISRKKRAQAKRLAWIQITGLAPSLLGRRRAGHRHADRKRDAKAGRSRHHAHATAE